MAACSKLQLIGIVCLTVTACASQSVETVEIPHDSDDQLSCEQLTTERRANLARAQALLTREEASGNNNIGIMIFPAIRPDPPEDGRREIRALNDRSQHLDALMAKKRCP